MAGIVELSENDLMQVTGGKISRSICMQYSGICTCSKGFSVSESRTKSVCACGNVFSLINYKVYCNSVELPESSYKATEKSGGLIKE